MAKCENGNVDFITEDIQHRKVGGATVLRKNTIGHLAVAFLSLPWI